MSNRGLEHVDALEQFAPEEPAIESSVPEPAPEPIARTSGVAAFVGWTVAMCVHPIAAWRRLSKVGRALVLAVYGLVGYTMGTLLLLTFY